MAKYNDITFHTEQEIEFTYEGNEYRWIGDYQIRQWGEVASYDYCGDSDQEARIMYTYELVKYNEDTDDWDHIHPTPSILATIENQIESTL